MSGLDVTFLNNITRTKFIKVVKNNIYNQSPLFNRLFAAGRVQDATGTAFEWSVVIRKHASVGRYSGYDVFANQPINPTTNAKLVPAAYYAALAVSGDEKRKNSGNMEKLLDIVKTQFDNAMSTLKDQMYTDAFGDGSQIGGRDGLIGLRAAVLANNTYANIDRTAAGNASWQANVISTAYADAQLKDPVDAGYMPSIMRTAYTNASHDHSPDLVVTTKKLFNLYQDIAGVQNLRFDNTKADLGFDAVQFQGGQLIFDSFCPAKAIYELSLQDWNVFVYPDVNFDMPEQGWMRPPNQDAEITQILWSGQMRLDSPWHQSVISAAGA